MQGRDRVHRRKDTHAQNAITLSINGYRHFIEEFRRS